ncbi:DegV family protein [Streptacidiphilus monticola]|jgi:DegV family protein with EDD domain|uniref:DegV family protein n=1 Tax=Streptacidiphilus monticola TaxID=2161674 RepID=A0ABW1G3X4_9ACTN
MSSRVAVVTDSTANLPAEDLARHGITVVPLSVVIGDRVLEEGREAGPGDVAAALQGRQQVTTSRPTPVAFAEAYAAAAAAGATEVVSLHLSAELSGTYEAAQLAAEEASVPVRVVDTRMIGLALGYCVLTAAEAVAGGATADQAGDLALARAKGTTGLFYVDTLEYLRRGGRIGAARALLGSALMVKPLLHLADGRIEPLEKVRTAGRAIARLEELAVAEAGEAPVDLAVHHLAAEDRAVALADRLRVRVPGLRRLHVAEVSAVIGAHVGPGLLAVVVSPR